MLLLILALQPKGPLGVDTLREARSIKTNLRRRWYDRALGAAKKLRRRDSSFVAYFNLAYVYQVLDSCEKAVALYDTAFNKASSNAEAALAAFNRALCYERLMRFDLAARDLDRYLRLMARVGVVPEDKSEVMARLEEVRSLAEVVKRAPKVKVEPVPGLQAPVREYGILSDRKGGDYSPVLTVDGRRMFFTSTRKGGSGREDIWCARLVGDSWGEVKPLWQVNTPASEGVSGVSVDGQTLYISAYTEREPRRRGVRRGYGNMDIFTVKRVPGGWGEPKNVGYPVSTKWWESQATVSPDGLELYFTSNRPGGQGGLDIWVSRKRPDGSWGEPVNLGPPINTPGDEIAPFMHPDGKTLYFASNGHLGFGGYDIFVTKKLGPGRWSQPVNLGPPYNTPKDDAFFSVAASGRWVYLARADSITPKGDTVYHIYRAELPPRSPQYEKILPEPLTLVLGKTFDAETRRPVPAIVSIQDLDAGKVVYVAETDPGTGEFQVILPAKKLYGITAEAKRGAYAFYSANFDLRDMEDYREYHLEVPLTPLKEGAHFVLRNIFFEFDKADLLPQSKLELDRLIKLLRAYPGMVIAIEGHTDSTGTYEYNMALSQRRAEAVYNYLIQHGVSPARIAEVKGYGYTRPVAPNDTPENRAKNRRVEIKIVRLTRSP